MNKELMDMLAYKRPAGSKTESMFISAYLDNMPGMLKDKAGNRIIKVGTDPDIMFSCHTDTVHSEAGFTMPQSHKGIVSANGEILGADDCAGVWLMRKMIFAGKAGLYIFHRGEEIGGIGSRHIAENNKKLLKGIRAAIALDRMGDKDIITHMGERTCSLRFAESLANGLGIKTLKPCSGGVFTDTYNYVGVVPECSNISVGYARAHSRHETLDTEYLDKLLDALLNLKLDKLETPGFEPDPAYAIGESWSTYRFDDDSPDRSGFEADPSLVDFIRQHPEKAAQMIIDYGLEDDIYSY